MADTPIADRFISVRGAREHNLANIHVDIPRDQLVVITGLSGSGKSSLAFDTIYAEGQRRYVESLSAYARQFLEMMQKPDVDLIEGLSPAISIEQKTTSRNPRSTVGTVTEIYDYMRLLWARVGIPYSPTTGLPITAQTVSQMVDAVLKMPAGTRLYLLAPIIRGRKGEYKKDMAEWLQKGFSRAYIDGEITELDNPPRLDKKKKHDIDIIVDRLIIKPEQESLATRLADSLETALGLSDGLVYAENADSGERSVFSARFACPVSGFTIDEIEPRLFSFNNPFGACPACDGLGVSAHFEAQLIVPDPSLSLKQGALAPWAKSTSKYYMQTLESLGAHYKFSLATAFADLPRKIQDILLYGSGDEAVEMVYDDGMRNYRTKKPFEGLIPNLERRYVETESNWVRDEMERFRANKPCDVCAGKRLKPEALAVKLADKNISQIADLSIGEAVTWFADIETHLSAQNKTIAARILKEIDERLGFLANVGLRYLNLSRHSGTLSGGESQRIRLASQIGSGLTGVLYVLDEPSIGLHQRDNERLLATLRRLRDLGNTVLVVEHDEDAIREADHVIDMGPGAGIHGGHVIAQGTADEISQHADSLTGQYLSGETEIPLPPKRREVNKKRMIKLNGATGHNLKAVNLDIPLGLFCCIAGVSGSGKSTLILETLWKTLSRQLHKSRELPAPYKHISGIEWLDKVVDIDQSPIGRTPRSNPATYTGAFTPIREWFAGLPEAKARGYNVGRFSFNVKGGRCETCQGDGVIKIEMHFLPDIYVTCDSCKGKRYNRETLEITWRGKSIADVLDMSVEEGVDYFKAVPSIRDKLQTMLRVGLGYVRIGQQATTLSGGEAQRVKLSKELSRRATGRTIYILDEPTTGLHFADIAKLLDVLQELVKGGNTVLVIEHNLDVLKTADWLIDMGPEGGDGGGEIVACGTPEDIASHTDSHTGRYLAPLLKSGSKSGSKSVPKSGKRRRR